VTAEKSGHGESSGSNNLMLGIFCKPSFQDEVVYKYPYLMACTERINHTNCIPNARFWSSMHAAP
jgi:hypothetical protein